MNIHICNYTDMRVREREREREREMHIHSLTNPMFIVFTASSFQSQADRVPALQASAPHQILGFKAVKQCSSNSCALSQNTSELATSPRFQQEPQIITLQNGGPQYTPQNTIIRIIATPEKVISNFWNLHGASLSVGMADTSCLNGLW